MDANAKKTALRMIPYGLYVLTAKGKDGAVTAATVNWVTQASFAPPLVVVGVKADSHPHPVIKEAKAFALNVLGKDQGPPPSPSSSPPPWRGRRSPGSRSTRAPRARRSWIGPPPSSSAAWWTATSAAIIRSSWARWWRLVWPRHRRGGLTTLPSG